MAVGFTFVSTIISLPRYIQEKKDIYHLPVKNVKVEFSDAQAEVFCSLFWV
jgi:hypothetical protein